MRSFLLLALALAVGSQTDASAQGDAPRTRGVRPAPRCDAPEPTEREADDKIYEPAELTCRAVLKSRPEPRYPPDARPKQVEGTVRLRVVLLASGKIGEVTVLKGLPEGVSEAAVEAARRIEFRPAIRGDRWVSQRIIVEYHFDLY